ncbi:MAG: CotH kinase family protein [Ruminococcus sp.]|nr:CotH kinase family protein [Ruminococcus sp.]
MVTKIMKKGVSLLLCAAILIASTFSLSFTAFAAEDDEEEFPEAAKIVINTEFGNGTTLLKEDGYVNAQVEITDADGSVLSDSAQIKVRGNTTALYWMQKKPFTIKFSSKKNVLGMGSGKKWALIANLFDPTLLRNYVAFDTAQKMDIEYTSNQRFVELWLDGSYRGCYTIYEPVQQGVDRVDIDIKSNGGKKDFLLEFENTRVEDDVTYIKCHGVRMIVSEPEEPSEEQLEYIEGTLNDIFETMKNGTREEIEQKVDVDSFAKFYVFNEFVKPFDFDSTSVFFYYKDGKLFAGPPWDYDVSACNSQDTQRSIRSNAIEGLFANDKNIYQFMCKHNWFYVEAERVYRENKNHIQDVYAQGGLMDRLRERYGDIFDKNFGEAGWDIKKAWINYQRRAAPTYGENFDFLKDWYRQRNEWLDGYFDNSVEDVLIGDSDGDDYIDIMDATLVQELLASLIEDDGKIALRVCDADAKPTINDATNIQLYLAELEPYGNVGKSERRFFKSHL